MSRLFKMETRVKLCVTIVGKSIWKECVGLGLTWTLYINKYKMCIRSGDCELAVQETSIRSRYKRKRSIIVQLHSWILLYTYM